MKPQVSMVSANGVGHAGRIDPRAITNWLPVRVLPAPRRTGAAVSSARCGSGAMLSRGFFEIGPPSLIVGPYSTRVGLGCFWKSRLVVLVPKQKAAACRSLDRSFGSFRITWQSLTRNRNRESYSICSTPSATPLSRHRHCCHSIISSARARAHPLRGPVAVGTSPPP